MEVEENWAIFVEGNQVKWSFGKPDSEFLQVAVNFVIGLSNLGVELFDEGVANIKFDLKKRSGFKASEIFIVSLQNTFFLIMSDPSVTLKLSRDSIPTEIEEIMRAVLVGQASILFGTAITEAKDQKGIQKIEKRFQNIILDINDKYADDIDHIIGGSTCNFSVLEFSDLIFLHYYLRREEQLPESGKKRCNWGLIAHITGGELPLDYNVDRNPLVLSGYLGIIISFLQTLFNSKPKSLTFGTLDISDLKFIHGEDYFMAISCELIDLFKDKEFFKLFKEIKSNVYNEIQKELKIHLIEELTTQVGIDLELIHVDELIDRVLKRKKIKY